MKCLGTLLSILTGPKYICTVYTVYHKCLCMHVEIGPPIFRHELCMPQAYSKIKPT